MRHEVTVEGRTGERGTQRRVAATFDYRQLAPRVRIGDRSVLTVPPLLRRPDGGRARYAVAAVIEIMAVLLYAGIIALIRL